MVNSNDGIWDRDLVQNNAGGWGGGGDWGLCTSTGRKCWEVICMTSWLGHMPNHKVQDLFFLKPQVIKGLRLLIITRACDKWPHNSCETSSIETTVYEKCLLGKKSMMTIPSVKLFASEHLSSNRVTCKTYREGLLKPLGIISFQWNISLVLSAEYFLISKIWHAFEKSNIHE